MMNNFYIQSIKKNGLDDQSLCIMRKTQKMLDAFISLRKKQVQAYTGYDNPELIYIDKTIKDFEKDLQTLQVNNALK